MYFLDEKDSCGTGFIVNIRGEKSHSVVADGLEALANLNHRGAVSADGKTGDGAGILTQIPYKFFVQEFNKLGIQAPREENLAVGTFFLPASRKTEIQEKIKEIIEEKFEFLGWREVPIDEAELGEIAKFTKPELYQGFISKQNKGKETENFEKELFILRKKLEKLADIEKYKNFYIPSLSSKTIVYKGLIIAPRLADFYLDLQNPDYESALALFHQRYSTNTSPNWKLAQPFRTLGHNGEINTITANRNQIRARANHIREVWGSDAEHILPLVNDEDSDSASLDNILEFLFHSGKHPFLAISMLIPKAWENDKNLTPEEKAFYEYFSYSMETWDGPAAIAFTNGEIIGAKLDRNGLRPSRYVVTDDRVLLASEAGVIDIPEEEIKVKGRLFPGDKLAIDIKEGKVYFSEEIIDHLVQGKEYKNWLDNYTHEFKPKTAYPKTELKNIDRERILYACDQDELEMVLKPMFTTGQEAVYSMGNDSPISILSPKSKLLSAYFKQRFAQVTNPPIDSIREKSVMSLRTYVGKRENFLTESPDHAKLLYLDSSIVFDNDLESLYEIFAGRYQIFSTGFPASERAMENSLQVLRQNVEEAVKNGIELIVLSDRNLKTDEAPIPICLAVSTINAYLSEIGVRSKFSILADTAEARDVHSIALLIGYGATLVNPRLAVQLIFNEVLQDKSSELTPQKALDNYRKAIEAGLLKIMAKMGISTVRSYRGASLYEALGISQEVIDEYFPRTPSKLSGMGLKHIARETIQRWKESQGQEIEIPRFGEYRFRQQGEFHAWNGDAIKALQKAVREEDKEQYKKFSMAVSAQKPANVRDLLQIQSDRASIPLSDVEAVQNITKRFIGAAMSIGALSREMHETIAEAMNFLGAKSNSGEGGEDPIRYGTNKNSRIKQVASGRFGVTPEYLNSADEIEIKIAQGAKPGEGGQLPGKKVDAYIAFLRYSQVGVTLISPPPHHDIYSIEDLSQLIYDLKTINPKAKVIVKLVSESGIGTIASGVVKAFADIIHISGHDGGTGASPLSSIRNAGSIWELGLTEVQQSLIKNNLRGNVKVRVDGGIRTGRDVIIASILGAEEFGFGTSLLIAAGCCMIRQCHLNTCPVGVATQDEKLRKNFKGKAEHIINYLTFVANEVRQILADCGYRSLDELIGRVDLLQLKNYPEHPKAKYIKLQSILDNPASYGKARKWERAKVMPKHALHDQLLLDVLPYIEKQRDYSWTYKARNIHRTLGAEIAHEITKLYGNKGMEKATIELKFEGTAGQSFGAFCLNSLNLHLKGQANDYVGKGMHGGLISVRPFEALRERSHRNVIIGNTVLYGATGGKLFVAGMAGERFGVRNSGATAVIEGVGDHGCEYMTGGIVLILGSVGSNFGAGFTGGTVYVHASNKNTVQNNLNQSSVAISEINQGDLAKIQELLEQHLRHTNSYLAETLLIDFHKESSNFVKVVPV